MTTPIRIHTIFKINDNTIVTVFEDPNLENCDDLQLQRMKKGEILLVRIHVELTDPATKKTATADHPTILVGTNKFIENCKDAVDEYSILAMAERRLREKL